MRFILWMWRLLLMVVLLSLANVLVVRGQECRFPKNWSGLWFHPEYPNEALAINETVIEHKGTCYEAHTSSYKYLLYNKYEKCYRCLVIHERHTNVLQFREGDCTLSASLATNCGNIPTDNVLISMFRKYPNVDAVPCPFKNSPFSFEYSSNGYQFCQRSNSLVQSCTDDTRMIFKFNSCPDFGMESKVTELLCLATWREGSNKYLVGIMSDAERKAIYDVKYYCFIYSEQRNRTHLIYQISQSADQNCNDIQSDREGDVIMRLISSNHTRCMFPSWATAHHTWYTLDHEQIYKFSSRNATLRILPNGVDNSKHKLSSPLSLVSNRDTDYDDDSTEGQNDAKLLEWKGGGSLSSSSSSSRSSGKVRRVFHKPRTGSANIGTGTSVKDHGNETKVICHSILEADEQKAQIVAHITTGCNSGYVCIVLHRRSNSIIELQQSELLMHSAEDACNNFGYRNTKFITLINYSKRPVPCPHSGRFVTLQRQHGDPIPSTPRPLKLTLNSEHKISPSNYHKNCDFKYVKSLLNGCNQADQLSLESSCDLSDSHQVTDFHCFGHWTDKETSVNYLIVSPVSRRSNDVNQYCFVYSFHKNNHIVPYHQFLHSADFDDDNDNGEHSENLSATPEFLQMAFDSGGVSTSLKSFTDSCHRSHPNPVWNLSFIFNGSCSTTSHVTAPTRTVPEVLVYFTIILNIVMQLSCKS